MNRSDKEAIHRKTDPTLAALKRRGFRYKKELGQHFLLNRFALEQIADSAGIAAGDVVVEAGAGAGSLTEVLAATGAVVVAVELDRSLIPFLRERFRDEPRVRIIHGDIMKLDPDALAAEAGASAPYKICANLPYHISSPFVNRAFRELKGLDAGAILLQKEVADKLTALPGEENYGIPALTALWFGQVRQVATLGPAYFYPPPQVDSAVVAFRRKPGAPGVEEKALWTVIRGLFNQRRKNLQNGFKSLGTFVPRTGESWASALEQAGVDFRRRPETLSLDEFAAILRAAGFTQVKYS